MHVAGGAKGGVGRERRPHPLLKGCCSTHSSSLTMHCLLWMGGGVGHRAAVADVPFVDVMNTVVSE